MKTVLDVMTTDVIWLGPDNKIKDAVILMKGRGIGGLPVLDGDQVVGMLSYQDILGKDPKIPIEHVMSREFFTIPPQMPVNDAADLMAKIGAGRIPVVDGSKLVGIVTLGDLIPEIGKSLDEKTGLLRVDAMRDWGIAALRRGQEITVIFIDLDKFGQFNKKYSHPVGDRVLKHIADVLRSRVDEQTDLLCRYGGDEFVIVTIRPGEEARELAARIVESIRSTQNPDLPEPVTGSVGVYGGKRTREREQVHYEATLDNLLTLASKACTRAKSPVGAQDESALAKATESQSPAQAPSPTTGPQPAGKLSIQSLNLTWGPGETAATEIELSDGVRSVKRARAGFALGKSALRLVADATADAASELIPGPGCGIATETVHVISETNSEDVVLVTAIFATPQKQLRITGSAIIRQDAYRATAAALLDAVNHQLA